MKNRCAFVYYENIVDSVDASEFNDKPEGGGDRAAQHLTPKLRLHRCYLARLLGIFLPRMSNEVAFRLVVKLAEGFRYRRIQ